MSFFTGIPFNISIGYVCAGDIAKATADSDALLKVARAWYDLAKYLGGEDDEEKGNPIGFLAELETLDEAGACGTAAVISPITKIDDIDTGHSYVFSHDGKPGPKCTELYNHLRGIQYGEKADKFGWITIVE